MSTAMAAAMGDADALTRMQAFARVMGKDTTLGLHDMPNLNDLILARHGDRTAMARLRIRRQTSQQEVQPKRGHAGLQTQSFASFHPPLNKRAKRLQKMGAHLTASTRSASMVGKILLAVLYVIIGPLLAIAGLLMLFVIGMMIALNLLFLALWLTAIHWIFAQDWNRNIRVIVGFVQELSAAMNRSR
jgi:hypothetical protein